MTQKQRQLLNQIEHIIIIACRTKNGRTVLIH